MIQINNTVSPAVSQADSEHADHAVTERENHFHTGETALESQQYPRAVSAFEAYLSTYDGAEDATDRKTLIKHAMAHTYIALGLLNGDKPRNRTPEETYQIVRRLDSAIDCAKRAGDADPLLTLAGALRRIIEEDSRVSARTKMALHRRNAAGR